jgi:multicomponent Na+:H+ antiporter subunit F
MMPFGQVGASGVLEPALNLAITFLAVAVTLAFVRLVRGPSLPDRVVAFELMITLAIGFIAVYDVLTEQPVFLDVATVMTLVAFLSSVAFSRYIEKGTGR